MKRQTPLSRAAGDPPTELNPGEHRWSRPMSAVRVAALRASELLPEQFAQRAARLAGVGHRSAMAPSADFLVVFDNDHYLANGALVPPWREPAEHFRDGGWRQGCAPHPLFDVAWYVDTYGDDFGEWLDPLTEFLESGWRAGRSPSPLFSTPYYLAESRRSGEAESNPLLHYLTTGCADGRLVSARHFTHMRAVDPSILDVPPTQTAVVRQRGVEPAEVPFESLREVKYRMVTFDAWDTLIGRSRPADAAKTATARRMATLCPGDFSTWDWFEARVAAEQAVAAANASEEYVLFEVLKLAASERSFVLADVDVQRLVDLEVVDEAAHTHRIAAVADLFASLQARSDVIVAVLSDFYLSAIDLQKILMVNDIHVDADRILVSCDLGASKRRGDVFQRVHAMFDVGPAEHLHIGDNQFSDIEAAHDAGVDAVLVTMSRQDWPSPGALTRADFDHLPRRISAEMESMLLSSTTSHQESWRISRARRSAGPLSVLAVGLVAAAIEAARSRSVPVVHYLSREGAFLAQVHRAVVDILCDGEGPRAVHLEVSRRSTFGPSVGRLDTDQLELIARQYPRQSIVGLLTSLGIAPHLLREQLLTLPINPKQIVDVRASGPVREFFERPDVRSIVESLLAEQASMLREYVDARELGDRGVVVDVGWRGSIQDNLCRLFPERTLHGVYFGLFPYLNTQPANGTKYAAAFDGNLGDAFGFADPPAVIESPFTPVLPTTIGYRRVDGRVEPIRMNEPGRAEASIEALQGSLLQVAPRVAERLVAFGAAADLLSGGLAYLAGDMYTAPPGGVADIWFDSSHDDTFGAANDTPYQKTPLSSDLLTSSTPTILLPGATASRWPEGYVRWAPVAAADGLRWLASQERP